jgi:hypothetical protein
MHIIEMFKNECVVKSEHDALKYSFASRQICQQQTCAAKKELDTRRMAHSNNLSFI